MKTLLLGINSKYIHTNLAIYYFKANITKNKDKILLKEISINDHKEKALDYIIENNIKIIAVSCYIWNITYIERLIPLIKEIDSEIIIIGGGPEIAFRDVNTLKSFSGFDYILRGEGEESLNKLLDIIYSKNFEKLSSVSGLVYKENNKYIENKISGNIDFDNVIFPYTSDLLKNFENRIVYYESSRGCPYKCSYCLSAYDYNIRYRSISKVKKELQFFIDNEIELVKFVDRTFNLNKERTKEIFEFLIKNKKNTRFHFEINADILDADIFEVLKNAPPGLFQFEIGVQSINKEVLEAINRKTEVDILLNNISKLIKYNNIHIHGDIIAGLPMENYLSLKKTFNKVYSIGPHYIQLGFLKLLKGTPLENDLDRYGYVFSDYSPFEIISNSYISQREILKLKGIEEVLMKFYNSKKFQFSLDYLISGDDPFEFYYRLFLALRKKDLVYQPQSPINLSEELYDFARTEGIDLNIFREKLRFDFILSNKSKTIPAFLIDNDENIELEKSEMHNYLNNQEIVEKYLPDYIGLPVKKIIKGVNIYKFSFLEVKHILIDYNKKNPITEQYSHYDISGGFT